MWRCMSCWAMALENIFMKSMESAHISLLTQSRAKFSRAATFKAKPGTPNLAKFQTVTKNAGLIQLGSTFQLCLKFMKYLTLLIVTSYYTLILFNKSEKGFWASTFIIQRPKNGDRPTPKGPLFSQCGF